MKFVTRFSFSVVLVVVLVPFLNAQQRSASSAAATTSAVSQSDAPHSCAHLFTSGASSSNTFIQYCVTDVGAITSIQTPFGHFHIGPGGEGYGLCQESPAVEYHDYAATWSDNWNFPQIVSKSNSAIKISRTTSDGNWTLVQTISKVAATGSIKVVMALTNNQNVDKVAYLIRFADVDIDGITDGEGEAAGASLQSAWAWHDDPSSAFHYGLQLENTGKMPFSYQQGFVRLAPTGPNACDFAAFSQPYGFYFTGSQNLSIVYAYVGAVASHQTLTVTMTYRGT